MNIDRGDTKQRRSLFNINEYAYMGQVKVKVSKEVCIYEQKRKMKVEKRGE